MSPTLVSVINLTFHLNLWITIDILIDMKQMVHYLDKAAFAVRAMLPTYPTPLINLSATHPRKQIQPNQDFRRPD